MFYTELIMSQVAALNAMYPHLTTAQAIKMEYFQGYLTFTQQAEWIRVLGL